MGILNVTPDSFSDGNRYLDLDRAVEHGLAMVRSGADPVDVGGESTRPGAERVLAGRVVHPRSRHSVEPGRGHRGDRLARPAVSVASGWAVRRSS
ncbi:dihydropteroate synthase [Nocardioides eburneus]|uniref:dihydropteroate synthase n=1 Tax=Nocardioides eburneus TaxID=3231482 RepID=UPI003F5D4E24